MGGAVSSPTVSVDEDLDSSIWQLVIQQSGCGNLQQHEDASFVERKAEMTQLMKVLAADPSRVALVLGPKDSGKSTLLQHLKQKWQSSCQVRQIFAPFLLINLHECLITNLQYGEDKTYYNSTAAKGLYSAIRDEVNAWADLATTALQNNDGEQYISGISRASIEMGVQNFSKSFRMEGFNLMYSLLNWLQEALKQHSHVRPVIVFDEAHVLKSWCSSHTQLLNEVQRLALFLQWLCKDKGRGHVVMATSDPFFWSWLSETLKISPLKMIPIGHFKEDEAKAFVVNHLLKKHEGILPAGGYNEDIWKELYRVTGGSPRLLKIVVSDAVELGSWTDAATSLVSSMEEALRESVLEFVTYRDMKRVVGIVGAIVQGGGLADFDEVMEHVYGGDVSFGRNEIKQLAEKGIVHVRLWTSGMMYMDVGEEKGDGTLYLMAADPASFVAMKRLFPAWFANSQKREEEKNNR
ncbi:hypothetical protein L7F22_051206 [Adiantum nelumboides]|nr:hypothetical protein [Adiantum nelumboides]